MNYGTFSGSAMDEAFMANEEARAEGKRKPQEPVTAWQSDPSPPWTNPTADARTGEPKPVRGLINPPRIAVGWRPRGGR